MTEAVEIEIPIVFEEKWTQKIEEIEKKYADAKAMEKYYGVYQIKEFLPTYYYAQRKFDALTIQEADMMIGSIIEINENTLVTYESLRWLGKRDGRIAFAGNHKIDEIVIENPVYKWEELCPNTEWYQNVTHPYPLNNYSEKIEGIISIQVGVPWGDQVYYVMEDSIIMFSTLHHQYFLLEKLNEEPEKIVPQQLSDIEKECILQEIYGNYRITDFLPTKYYPALDSGGDIALPQGEVDLMIGKEVVIENGKFVTYDNFRHPNSEACGRAMDEYLIDEVEIANPNYQIEVKIRNDIYGLRDDMLSEEMIQERYVEISVFPGYEASSIDDVLPQMYLLNDKKIILYAMGEYFLLVKEEIEVTENVGNPQFTCEKVSDGYELNLYSKSKEKVFSAIYPKEPGIKEVSEDILQISISLGSPACYVFYFNETNAEISETFFNPIYFGDKYVAYMENEKLVLKDVFDEGLVYKEIERDFTKTADPISAIIKIEMLNDGNILLKYYREDYVKRTEVIEILED